MTNPEAPTPARLRRWADVAMLGRAAMEALWISLWYALFFLPGPATAWVCLAFWAIMALSYGLSLGMERFRLSVARRRWLFLGWLALASLLTLRWLLVPQPPAPGLAGLLDLLSLPLRALLPASPSPLPFLHCLAVLLLGLRGLALARGLPDTRAAIFDFQIGLVFILLYGLSGLPAAEGVSPAPGQLSDLSGLEVYLFLGLITLGATRIWRVSASQGGRLARFGPGWSGGLILGAGLVVGAGLLGGLLAASQASAFLARLVLGLIALLGLIFFMILLPVLELILRLLGELLDKLSGLLDSPLFQTFQNLLASLNLLAAQTAQRNQNLFQALQVALPLLILLGLLALAWAWLRLRSAWQDLRLEEQEEGLPPPGITALLRRLARRGLARRGLPAPARLLAAARIRRVYAGLLRLSERLGQPRPAHQTPLEFLPRLNQLFAGEEAGLERITAAYLRVRYGEYPESLGEVQEIENDWKRIRAHRHPQG